MYLFFLILLIQGSIAFAADPCWLQIVEAAGNPESQTMRVATSVSPSGKPFTVGTVGNSGFSFRDELEQVGEGYASNATVAPLELGDSQQLISRVRVLASDAAYAKGFFASGWVATVQERRLYVHLPVQSFQRGQERLESSESLPVEGQFYSVGFTLPGNVRDVSLIRVGTDRVGAYALTDKEILYAEWEEGATPESFEDSDFQSKLSLTEGLQVRGVSRDSFAVVHNEEEPQLKVCEGGESCQALGSMGLEHLLDFAVVALGEPTLENLRFFAIGKPKSKDQLLLLRAGPDGKFKHFLKQLPPSVVPVSLAAAAYPPKSADTEGHLTWVEEGQRWHQRLLVAGRLAGPSQSSSAHSLYGFVRTDTWSGWVRPPFAYYDWETGYASLLKSVEKLGEQISTATQADALTALIQLLRRKQIQTEHYPETEAKAVELASLALQNRRALVLKKSGIDVFFEGTLEQKTLSLCLLSTDTAAHLRSNGVDRRYKEDIQLSLETLRKSSKEVATELETFAQSGFIERFGWEDVDLTEQMLEVEDFVDEDAEENPALYHAAKSGNYPALLAVRAARYFYMSEERVETFVKAVLKRCKEKPGQAYWQTLLQVLKSQVPLSAWGIWKTEKLLRWLRAGQA